MQVLCLRSTRRSPQHGLKCPQRHTSCQRIHLSQFPNSEKATWSIQQLKKNQGAFLTSGRGLSLSLKSHSRSCQKHNFPPLPSQKHIYVFTVLCSYLLAQQKRVTPVKENTRYNIIPANSSQNKGRFQKLLSGFFPLRGGGGPPPFAKLFWAQWLSVEGGGSTPQLP